MKQITATKKTMMCGHSLVVNITKEAEALEIGRGDFVEITVKKPAKDHD